ncbi:MAG: flagellar basal-body rod protein FlgG [Chloroflexota bacterium]
MDPTLWNAALGLLAQQTNLDVVAHNVANINTVGFKRAMTNFENLASAEAQIVSPDTWPATPTPEDLAAALGAVLATPKLVFSQGNLQSTDNPLDVAINGEGFFQVQQADGSIAYTRNGSFKIDGSGRLTTSSGCFLLPLVNVPTTASGVVFRPNGEIHAQISDTGASQRIGSIQLAVFADPSALVSIGGNLYVPTDSSGQPTLGNAGTGNCGALICGMLEMSNVDLVSEMTSLILSQRAYQMNLRTLETIDQMAEDAVKLQG